METSTTPSPSSTAIPTDDLPSDETRRASYVQALRELGALLDGQPPDPVTAMASAASVLHGHLPYASWTGFYRVVAPELLRVGPYQGPVGCLEIPFARGVCGAAARERAPQLVADVHAFPGHIACDAASRSEVVVPVVTPDGTLVAVLDVDSHQPDAFGTVDVEGCTAVAELVGRAFVDPVGAPSGTRG